MVEIVREAAGPADDGALKDALAGLTDAHVAAVKRELDNRANPNGTHENPLLKSAVGRYSGHVRRAPRAADAYAVWEARAPRFKKMVELLLEAGADPNFADTLGGTPLMSAPDNLEMVELLLAKGADPNLADNKGTTPLHLAAGLYGDPDTIRLLRRAGGNVNAEDNEHRTPIQIASRKPELKEALEEPLVAAAPQDVEMQGGRRRRRKTRGGRKTRVRKSKRRLTRRMK